MRAAVSWAPRKQHHGGVRSQRAVCSAENDGPVVGGDFGSYRHREVQAGDRDRKTASGRDNQRRLHAGRKTVNTGKRAAGVLDMAAIMLKMRQNKTSAVLPNECRYEN